MHQALVLDMQSIENISVLVKGGVRLSLDDFGTGHSSIMRLAGIPFGQIKLDSGFVANALGLKETRIIEAVVGLARSLAAFRLLIVLDNCEHVLDEASDAVAAQLMAGGVVPVSIEPTNDAVSVAGGGGWRGWLPRRRG